MRSIGILCRRGTSSILGTLIFVGIMFTAVIPMLLVMNQADTLHEMRKHELEILDNERLSEDLHVYVFPAEDPSDLTLRVENRGDFTAKIVKTWINEDSYLEDFIVQPMAVHNKILEDYFIPENGKYYFIKVTTDRGNIFTSDSGSVFCNSGGNWECELFTINFLISYPEGGKFDVVVSYGDNEIIGVPVDGGVFEIHKSAVGSAYDFLHVYDSPRKYHIRITKNDGLEIYSRFKDLEWPGGPSVIWVFA